MKTTIILILLALLLNANCGGEDPIAPPDTDLLLAREWKACRDALQVDVPDGCVVYPSSPSRISGILAMYVCDMTVYGKTDDLQFWLGEGIDFSTCYLDLKQCHYERWGQSCFLRWK